MLLVKFHVFPIIVSLDQFLVFGQMYLLSFKFVSDVLYITEHYGGCQKLNATILFWARDWQLKP